MFDSYNLLEIRELYGLSQTDLAKRLDITREVVNKMEKGKMKVSKRTAARLQGFLQEHPYGFYSGDVNILGKSSQTSEKRRSNVPFQKQRLEEKNTNTPFLVPLVGIKAQAGYVKGFEQVDYIDSLEKYSLPTGVNPTGAVWSYFEVDGESMEPSFYSGDVILASMLPHEDWNEIRNFYVYVILTDQQLLVKRVFRKNEKEWVL